MPLSNYEEE